MLAVGLFHLIEQETADLCRDASFEVPPPDESRLAEVASWYRVYFSLDFEALTAWGSMNELRLVANLTKHGEGPAARELRQRRPELFQSPMARLIRFVPEGPALPVFRPLAGEDLYVTPEILAGYYVAAVDFMNEIAEFFQQHRDDYFPRQNP